MIILIKKVTSCKIKCAIDETQPINNMLNWWKGNGPDFESSICIFDLALKFNL